MFEQLDRQKARLDSLRPLPPALARNLHEDLVLRWTYHSNAIEGNTLTLKETRVVLEGITVGGKLLREHFEAINHRDAILFVEQLVTEAGPLTEWQIRAIHQLVLRHIDDEQAGRYRAINVLIAGADARPPDGPYVPAQMASLIRWLEEAGPSLHPVERAARLHADFVKIHPFADGNGRTARLLMNLELLKAGFPAVVLPVEQRLRYYEALDLAHTRDSYGPFLALIADCVEAGFAVYWRALGLTEP
ncbi:MAG TPA: Fic family protein [Chloroflexaceae bacterium]|nr:Fic family protein [Chloroflexaceae bacterium]